VALRGEAPVRRNISREETYIADECFLTGTAAEVTPIREIDARVIGAGSRGPITEKLQTAYFDVVAGKNPDYIKKLVESPGIHSMDLSSEHYQLEECFDFVMGLAVDSALENKEEKTI